MKTATWRRLDQLETAAGRGQARRWGDPDPSWTVDAWRRQLDADQAAGVSWRERADLDLARWLATYRHPADQVAIRRWHRTRMRQMEHIAGLEP